MYFRHIALIFAITTTLFANIPQSTLLSDAIGSTRALADSSGHLSDSYDYSPYGTLLRHSGSSDTPLPLYR